MEYTVVPIIDEKGEISYFESIGRDITERKKAEEKIRQQNEFLESILESLTHPLYVIDVSDYTIKMANSAAYLYGSSRGATCHSLTHNSDKPCRSEDYPCPIEEVKKTKKAVSMEHIHIDKDGNTHRVEIHGHPILDSDMNVVQMIEYSIDITEQKHLEEQLQIRQRMDSLGTLAGGIAHDFNNLLVGIMGNIDLLNMETENLTEFQKECLKNADISCERAASLIKQFQMLSRGIVSEKTSVDIYETAKEVFDLLKKTTDRLIKKRIDFKSGEFHVTAAPAELNQVFLNLGTNAAQAIEERGVKQGDYISIKAEDYSIKGTDITGLPEREYVHILFEDNGIGMSDEVKKRAFDPLFTTREKGVQKGQGLGLAMVYNIITRNHDGHINIESEEGKGTTFHIYLPKAYPKENAELEEIMGVAGGNETVLIIEDEEIVLNLAENILKKYGYNVLKADDGQKGLDTYIENKDSIDLVLLDLTMPEMSGQMVFEEMLRINPDVKVIISTGHTDEDARKGILSLAKDFVSKPYKTTDLAQAVRTVLDL